MVGINLAYEDKNPFWTACKRMLDYIKTKRIEILIVPALRTSKPVGTDGEEIVIGS